ncbi:MAG: DUF4388 domain-containing protein [Thermoanaerobaculia bacterium]
MKPIGDDDVLTPDEVSMTTEIAEALLELQQYLSDNLAPLMVAESISILLEQPASLAALHIEAWAAGQYKGPGASVPASDYLFHAVKKIHLMGEYKLVPAAKLARYLAELGDILDACCPEGDRQLLAENLGRLGQTGTMLSSPVSMLHRQMGAESSLASGAEPSGMRGAARGNVTSVGSMGAGGSSDELVRSLRVFNLLADRLASSSGSASSAGSPGIVTLAPEEHAPAGGGSGAVFPVHEAPRTTPSVQLLEAAVTGAETTRQLQELLDRLRHLGVPGTGDVVRSLSRALPDWTPPRTGDTASGGRADATGGVARAIRRVVTLGEPEEADRKLRELVQTAIEHVNEGSLSRSVALLDVAEKIIVSGSVTKEAARMARSAGRNALDSERLRVLSERADKRILLRRVLEFFPAFSPQRLLAELEVESKRDARRLIIALVECHGLAGRAAAMDRLQSSATAATEGDWRFQRNLLYLIRRINRQAGTSVEAEIELLERFSEIERSPSLVKEALSGLGQIKHERSAQALLSRLRGLENFLMGTDELPHPIEEMRQMLDRTVNALTSVALPQTLRAVIDHGLKKQPRFGDTVQRLASLSAQDLSAHKELTERLVKALESVLPVKVFGMVLPGQGSDPGHLVAALSSTPTPRVKEVLARAARLFPDREFGKAAGRALAAYDHPPESGAVVLSGDVELFGLPTLFQTLDQSSSTGVLSLRNAKGETVATLTFESGKLRDCRVGTLRGLDAAYQLFERPADGHFVFTRRDDVRSNDDPFSEPREVVPILLEGMRRYDEVQHALALIGDGTAYKSTAVKPSSPAEETDAKFLHAVWTASAAGTQLREIERQLATDTYRCSRLMAHWIEEGALVAR